MESRFSVYGIAFAHGITVGALLCGLIPYNILIDSIPQVADSMHGFAAILMRMLAERCLNTLIPTISMKKAL